MRNLNAHLLRRTIFLSSLAALGFSMHALFGDVAPATQPTTMPAVTAPTASPDIDKLITQLGSDNSDERDEAQKKLEAAGTSAVPALKKAAATSDDPEIKSRAAAALAAMKDLNDTGVSLITLHMKDASVHDVLAELSKQSHSQIIGMGPGRVLGVDNRNVTLDADQKPFWDVMSDLCTQLNVCPMIDLSGNAQLRLMSVNRSWMQAPHQTVGPFWISVVGVNRTRTIDLQGPQAIDDQFSVRLMIVPEPKIAVAQMSDLTLTEATDDAGHSLMPKAARPNNAAFALGLVARSMTLGQTNRTIETRLSYPEQPGTKIALLKGSVDVQISQDVQQYIVDDVMGTQKITNPLKNCTVQAAVVKQGTYYRVTIDCTREGLSDEQWLAMMNRASDITLEDADGHPLTALTHMVPLPTSDTTFKTNLLFSNNPNQAMGLLMGKVAAGGAAPAVPAAKIGDPKKLTWNVATSIKSMKIPVEFKDLPMP